MVTYPAENYQFKAMGSSAITVIVPCRPPPQAVQIWEASRRVPGSGPDLYCLAPAKHPHLRWILIYLHHQQVGMAPKERGGRVSRSLQQAAFLCLSARRHLSALFLRATTMPHGCLSPKASQRDRKTLGLSPCLTRQKTCYFTWQYHCPESLPQKAECRGDALHLPVAEANHWPKTIKLVANEARPQRTGTCWLA